MSLELSNSKSIDCKCSSGSTGCGFLENEIGVGDYYLKLATTKDDCLYFGGIDEC